MKYSPFLEVAIRYFLLILAGLGILGFYFVFTPLTIYSVYFLLGLFFDVALIGSSIIIKQVPIEIIGACVAGSAYYLLLILNLATPNIKLKKRIIMLALAFLIFLIVNVLRIFFLSLLFLSGSSWFDFTHEFFWYFISIVFVVVIWFAEVKLFKIKSIPFYSDIKFAYKKSLLKNKFIKSPGS